MRRPERGLTLLEVLGAVALLGILYTVLAGSATEGVRSEGESRRRLEASLRADDRLAEIELAAAAGTLPPIGSTEEEIEDVRIATEVSAFEMPAPAEDAAGAEPSSLAAKRAAARAENAPSLFDPPRSSAGSATLLRIDVVVRWTEGIDEREVRRTTFVVDEEAVEERFAALAERPGQPPGQRPEAQGEDEAGGGRGRQKRPKDQPLPRFEIPPAGEPEEEEP